MQVLGVLVVLGVWVTLCWTADDQSAGSESRRFEEVDGTSGKVRLIVSFANGTVKSRHLVRYIDEETVGDLDPDWVRQTKKVSAKSGAVTVTVLKPDGSEKVRRLRKNNASSASGEDWTQKVRQVSPVGGAETVTVLHADGSQTVGEMNPVTGLAKTTRTKKDGTRILKELNPGLDLATETVFRPDGSQRITELHPKSGVKKVTSVDQDGTRAVLDFDPVTGLEIEVTQFRDGSRKIARVDTRSGLRNETRLDRDGTEIVEEIDPLTRIVTNSLRFPNGTQKIRATDPETSVRTLTLLSRDGTREVRNVDPETRWANVSILHVNGTRETRNYDAKSGIESVSIFHPDGSTESRETDPTSGTTSVTLLRQDKTEEVTKIYPMIATINVRYLKPSGRESRRVDDAEIDERLLDFVDPGWIRQIRSLDSETGSVTVIVLKEDGTQKIRKVKEVADKVAFVDREWAHKIRATDPETGVLVETVLFLNGSRKIWVTDPETKFKTELLVDENGISDDGEDYSDSDEDIEVGLSDPEELSIVVGDDGSQTITLGLEEVSRNESMTLFRNGTQKYFEYDHEGDVLRSIQRDAQGSQTATVEDLSTGNTTIFELSPDGVQTSRQLPNLLKNHTSSSRSTRDASIHTGQRKS